MGMTTTEASQIAEKLRAALNKKGITAAEAARSAHIDPSRLCRILQGAFATFNPNVLQICNFLGVSTQDAEQQGGGPARICASALQVWDGTAEDVEEVVKLLEQIALLRRHR